MQNGDYGEQPASLTAVEKSLRERTVEKSLAGSHGAEGEYERGRERRRNEGGG